MSLVHIVVSRITGYDNFTLHFDDRCEKDIQDEAPFLYFEREFLDAMKDSVSHPEFSCSYRYYGYIIFPKIDADSIYNLYKCRCESKPVLKRRYNIYFDQEHVHLEDVIKKFDRPLQPMASANFRLKHYSHRLEYFERSIQILRDIQTAIYETDSDISKIELELHNRFFQNSDGSE
jgi:hypothetical protein